MVLKAREKPIITLMDMMQNKVMKRFQEKKGKEPKFKHIICPRIIEKLNYIRKVVKCGECNLCWEGSLGDAT